MKNNNKIVNLPTINRSTVLKCTECGHTYCMNDHDEVEGFVSLCPSCLSRACSDGIGNYHDSHGCPLPFFYEAGENRKDNLHLGFELEVDCCNSWTDRFDTVDAITSTAAYYLFNFEEDCSLEDGFENISHPMSIGYFTNSFQPILADFVKAIRQDGWRSHDTDSCGLHVHIDRQYAAGQEDSFIAKLLFLMERYWDNFVKFSRRNREQLNRWASKYTVEHGKNTPYSSIVKKAKQDWYRRYYALNLTNKNTIEFRLWRGSLNLRTINATIKFTARLCELAKEKKAVELARMSWNDLLGTDEDILGYWEAVKNR